MSPSFMPFLLLGAIAGASTDRGCGTLLDVPSPASPADGPQVTITFVRGGCFGECPQYSLVISPGGRVRYEGEDFVRVKGTRQRMLPPTAWNALVERFRSASYFDLEDQYEHPYSGYSGGFYGFDSEWNCLRFEEDGRTKAIGQYGEAGPLVLLELERFLEDVTEADEWTLKGGERRVAHELRMARGLARSRIEEMLKRLQRSPPGSRFAIAREVLDLGIERGVIGAHELTKLTPVIAAALSDPDAAVRQSAAAALEYFWSRDGLAAAATAALRDPVSSVRRQAALALYRMAPRAPAAAVPLLIEAARDDDIEVRVAAIRALVEADGVAARSVVAESLASSEPIRLGTVRALYELERGVLRRKNALDLLPALVGRLTDSSWKVRAYTALVLGSLGADARAAESALERLQDADPAPAVRSNASVALGAIRAPGSPPHNACDWMLKTPSSR